MSYLRVPGDDSEDPLFSPWRIKAKEHTRRSLLVRRATIVIASLAFAVPFILLLYHVRGNHSAAVSPMSQGALLSHTSSLPATSLLEDIPSSPSTSSTSLAATPTQFPNSTVGDPVVLSLIMWSTDSAREGAVLMKSIIMYSSSSLEFHIVCDGHAQEYLEKRLALVHHPRYNILVRFYRITREAMIARLSREGAVVSDHSAGTPGLMKLFIHEILPTSIKKSIFLDTDTFFISDPVLLWDHFKRLDPAIAVSMPSHSDQSEPAWHDANKICSCIMLLNLEKLRELRLMDSTIYRSDPQGPPALSPPAFRAMYGPPGPEGHYEGVKLGDQGYWWAIISHNNEIFEPLSFDWEISSCLMDMYFTGLGHDDASESEELASQVHTDATPQEGQVVLPKLLHFNCLDAPTYYEWVGWSDPNDSLTRRWGASVRYHKGFKWLWLNQGTGNSALTLEDVRDVVFYDELSVNVSISRRS